MAAADLQLLLLPEREREGDSERQKEIDGKREKQAHRYLVSVQMEKRRQMQKVQMEPTEVAHLK